MKFCVVIEQEFGYNEEIIIEATNSDSAVTQVTNMYPYATVRKVCPEWEQDNR